MSTHELASGVTWTAMNPGGWLSHEKSGKWVIWINASRAQRVWNRLVDATRDGQFPCIIVGNDKVVELCNGRQLISVYCDDRDRGTLMRTLINLRDLGIEDDLWFQSDFEFGHLSTEIVPEEYLFKAEGYRLISKEQGFGFFASGS